MFYAETRMLFAEEDDLYIPEENPEKADLYILGENPKDADLYIPEESTFSKNLKTAVKLGAR